MEMAVAVMGSTKRWLLIIIVWNGLLNVIMTVLSLRDIAETLLGLFTCLSPTGEGGGMRYERKEGLRHFITAGTLTGNFE